MPFIPRRKTIHLLFIALLLCSTDAMGQFKNFGTNARRKPEPNYFFSVYGYVDLVREKGLGFQYQLLHQYNMDVAAYLINPNTYFKDKILQWNYYDLKGYGISFKPKFLFSALNRSYVGLNLAYERLQHDIVPVQYYNGKGSNIVHYLEEAKGYAYTIGVTLGHKFMYKPIFIEPFFGLGVTASKLTKTVYGVDYKNSYDKPFPYSFVDKRQFFQMNIGLKMGLSFKKSKKHAAVDKKFDDVYIPKAKSMGSYFKSVNFNKSTSKYLRHARDRYESLNRSALRRYKKSYNDTTHFYNSVNNLFIRIDSLIVKGNR